MSLLRRCGICNEWITDGDPFVSACFTVKSNADSPACLTTLGFYHVKCSTAVRNLARLVVDAKWRGVPAFASPVEAMRWLRKAGA